MNEKTSKVIREQIKRNCLDLRELMQDYLTHNEEYGYRFYLLMLALDEINGNEDSTMTYHEMFAEDYPDKDLEMVTSKEAVLYNRKVLENYKKLNDENG